MRFALHLVLLCGCVTALREYPLDAPDAGKSASSDVAMPFESAAGSGAMSSSNGGGLGSGADGKGGGGLPFADATASGAGGSSGAIDAMSDAERVPMPDVPVIMPTPDAVGPEANPVLPCTNLCSPGTARCAGSEVQICVVAATGCTNWGPPAACPAPQTCGQDNRCACSPATVCPTVGAKACGPTGGVRECIRDGLCAKWNDEKACTAPNGTSQCLDGNCSLATCANGYNKCGSVCARADDVNACGVACRKCPVGPNSSAVCAAGSCDLRCNSGYARCAFSDTCERVSWTFESNTSEGLDFEPGRVVNESHSGQKGLLFELPMVKPDTAMVLGFGREFACGNVGVTTQGRTFSSWVFVRGPYGANPTRCQMIFRASSSENDVYSDFIGIARDTWVRLTMPIPIDVKAFEVYCSVRLPEGGTATMIVDDVTIE